MREEKFKKEVFTLKKFFSIYCQNKHQNQSKIPYLIKYKDLELNFEISLCNECKELFEYAIQKLKECPNDPKPRCRKCKKPCYEKEKFKQMAKLMRYSGIKLGLSKITSKFRKKSL